MRSHCTLTLLHTRLQLYVLQGRSHPYKRRTSSTDHRMDRRYWCSTGACRCPRPQVTCPQQAAALTCIFRSPSYFYSPCLLSSLSSLVCAALCCASSAKRSSCWPPRTPNGKSGKNANPPALDLPPSSTLGRSERQGIVQAGAAETQFADSAPQTCV